MKNVEIPKWLQELPLAPEFRPTDTEFADPIAYITKIEREASSFGICKIIPPLPKPSRKFVFHNLKRSLSKSPELGSDVRLDSVSKEKCDGDLNAVFTTRSQELGIEKRKRSKGTSGDSVIGPKKQVWQSGEVYTLEQFEAKSRSFAKSQLGTVKEVDPLVVEAMFWKASSETPIYVEYANDVPGSAFGEPEGLTQFLDRRRNRRRRKRNSFDRKNLGNIDIEGDQIDTLNKISDANSQINSKSCMRRADSASSNRPSSETSFSGQKEFEYDSAMECTSGWKLSNSLWNLQVIARSPGSLTRFMPDDIPGVTSPMVYIGMLFSWFAWHVEDHELHSLNYLHVGSPKTWYSVPGHYASNFEEAIRINAHGANADRFDALSRLGEKTTVISPEVIISSGIPCFRLVQNPGDFVVTFPRAYHIGFSHGFNCGEAANFGTPRWLDVAKEAAVRRAAMDYLPMLSHQQLLYLLTMSFISRVPRSLLPGVRSSRFKERLREERELLVKKAFVEDICHENNQLRFLLGRNSSYRLVSWDAESLPSSCKLSEVFKNAGSVSSGTEFEKNDAVHELIELNDFMNAAGPDFFNDDLSYDFQVESGALPCVACGLLGFPFMAVLQPILTETTCTLLADHDTAPVESCHKSDVSHLSNSCMKAEWNVSDAFMKPRVFCLEHAIEVEELLSSKCRLNALVICHSDFQKVIAHASTVAEEVAIPFSFTELPLENASPADMQLIDISIDTEEHDCAKNWTSLLSINLQHLVKVKKSGQHENSRCLLSVRRLFSSEIPISGTSSVKWKSRKLRSKRQPQCGWQSKHSDGSETVNQMKADKNHPSPQEDAQIIQYSRRKDRVCSKPVKSDVTEVHDSHDDLGSREPKFDDMVCNQDSPKENEDHVSCGTPETSSQSDPQESFDSDPLGKCFSEGIKVSDASIHHNQTFKDEAISVDESSNNIVKKGFKRREVDQLNAFDFIRSPCEGLRPRARAKDSEIDYEPERVKRARVVRDDSLYKKNKKMKNQKVLHRCNIENCKMSFKTVAELLLHKDDRCHTAGCRKKFSSHKSVIQHLRVHDKDRPLKCPWKGCTMSFKWAWARTEHLRVHTGERPYTCKVEGCGLTFRFISDFSRHRRKTSHYVK